MDPIEYEIMYRVEDWHWWYRGMERITRAVLDTWHPDGSGLRILDAGCGTGAAMATYLTDYGKPVGLDVSALALGYCRRRKLERLVRASITDLPLASQSFELITSFDVLYERGVPDEMATLAEFARLLVPGGYLLLRLPAYDWLRGQHDKTTHTARRYTTGRIADLLRRNGFTVRHLSYADTFLFPLALVKRLAEHLWPGSPPRSDLSINMGPLDGLFCSILKLEAPLVAGPGLPFGLSVIAVGQRPA